MRLTPALRALFSVEKCRKASRDSGGGEKLEREHHEAQFRRHHVSKLQAFRSTTSALSEVAASEPIQSSTGKVVQSCNDVLQAFQLKSTHGIHATNASEQ